MKKSKTKKLIKFLLESAQLKKTHNPIEGLKNQNAMQLYINEDIFFHYK